MKFLFYIFDPIKNKSQQEIIFNFFCFLPFPCKKSEINCELNVFWLLLGRLNIIIYNEEKENSVNCDIVLTRHCIGQMPSQCEWDIL